MREAREILREYRDRKRSDAGADAPEALREENLRRLLRHVGAAHQPPEPFEDRLLRAMLRTGEERAARQSRRGGIQLSRPVWQVWAPAAAALVVSALLFAAQLSHSSHPTAIRMTVASKIRVLILIGSFARFLSWIQLAIHYAAFDAGKVTMSA